MILNVISCKCWTGKSSFVMIKVFILALHHARESQMLSDRHLCQEKERKHFIHSFDLDKTYSWKIPAPPLTA